MNFSRKTILVVGAALLAACGDKVTVQEYTPPPPTAKVNSVEVTPLSATLNIGQTITMTAAVNADAGLATTVTWSSSDATKASVSTAGVVTAVAATPGVAICATSTVDTGKKGCATVVVTPATQVIPATVSINSITAQGNLNGTVNPAAVAGAIDVTLNINPGNQTISKVEVLFGSVVAYTQNFTAAQAAALRFAADEAVAAQTTFPQVVAPINTAAFNATTGVPTWMNGPTTLQAKIYTTASGSSQAASASVSQTLTLANANAFSTTTAVANSGTPGAANNAAGFRYTRGDLTATIITVSYNGVAADNIVVNFGTAACDGSATAQRTKAATKSGSTFTATFANSGAAAATNLSNYSFNAGACAAANLTGEQFSIVAATDAAGNAFTTTALPINVGSGYRMDNWAPTAPTLNFTIASVRNNANWVNDGVAFNALAASGGAISVASTDNVGGVGLSTTATSVYQVTVGGNVIANASSLAESATNATYTATAKAVDLVGNTSAASAAATFGVDRTIPTFTYGGPADATALAAAPNATLLGALTYSDPATVPAGPSNPSATPVRYLIQRRTTATASTLWNNGAGVFNATGGEFSAALAGVNLEPAGATNIEAYYVVTMYVEDGAANKATSITRTYLYDITAPTGPFSIPVATASAGQSNIFTSTAADNLDVATTQWAMTYAALAAAPGAAGASILLPTTAFGSFASFTTTAASSANYPLFRSMLNVAGGVPNWATAGSLTNVAHMIMDRRPAPAVATVVANAIPAANVPTIPAGDPYAAAGFAGTGFSVTNAAVNVDISGNGTAPTLNSVDLTATAVGTANTFVNPFARVDFFVYDATNNNYRLIGSATSASVQDIALPLPGTRVYTWTVNWNPDAVGQYNNPNAVGAQNIVAIGWNSTFDAVRSAANANITTVP
jgi:hypothetical protein